VPLSSSPLIPAGFCPHPVEAPGFSPVNQSSPRSSALQLAERLPSATIRIRARLQSCRTSLKIPRALAPETISPAQTDFFSSLFSRASKLFPFDPCGLLPAPGGSTGLQPGEPVFPKNRALALGRCIFVSLKHYRAGASHVLLSISTSLPARYVSPPNCLFPLCLAKLPTRTAKSKRPRNSRPLGVIARIP